MRVSAARFDVPRHRDPLRPQRLLSLERICERERISLSEAHDGLRLLGVPLQTSERGTYISTRHERKLRRVVGDLVETRWRAERAEGGLEPNTPPVEDTVQTYFIVCGEFVKIGFSIDAAKRMRDLQTACPYPLRIVATAPGGHMTERRWHVRFREYGHRDEWFRYEGELRTAIEALPTFALPTPHRAEGA